MLAYHCLFILGFTTFCVNEAGNQTISREIKDLTKQDQIRKNKNSAMFDINQSINSDNTGDAHFSDMCGVMSSTEEYNITVPMGYTYGLVDYFLKEFEPCPVEVYWRISSPPGTVLNVSFTYFITRHCSIQCLCDKVTIWDVIKETKQIRGKYCGNHDPWYILSKRRQIVIGLEILNAESSYTVLTRVTNHLKDTTKADYDEVTGFVIMYRVLPADQYSYISPINSIGKGGSIYLYTPHLKVKDDYIYHFKIHRLKLGQVSVLWSFRCRDVSLLLMDGPSERYIPITKYKVQNNMKIANATGFHMYIILKINKKLFGRRRFCVDLRYSNHVKPQIIFVPFLGSYRVQIYRLPFVHVYHPKHPFGILRFGIRGPNHDGCTVQGVTFLMVKTIHKYGKKYFSIHQATFCDIPEHKKFISENINSNVQLKLYLIVYSYVVNPDNHALHVTLSSKQIQADSEQLCKPVYPDLFNFDLYTKTIVHVNNITSSSRIEASADNVTCFYVRLIPVDKGRNTNITLEISGVDFFIANSNRELGPNPTYDSSFNVQIKTNRSHNCTGQVIAKKDTEKNRVIIRHTVDCVYTPVGFGLDLYNNMKCFTLSPKQSMLLENICQKLLTYESASVFVYSNFILYLYCDNLSCANNKIYDRTLLIKQSPIVMKSDLDFSFLYPKSFKIVFEPVVGNGISAPQYNKDVDNDLFTKLCRETSISWNEAFFHCKEQGFELLTIDDISELHRLRPKWANCLPWSEKAFMFIGLKNGRWVNGDPVTYNEWYTPDDPLEYKGLFGIVKGNGSDFNCTALIDVHLGTIEKATYWMHVPCDHKFSMACFMCKLSLPEQFYDISFTTLYIMPHIVNYDRQYVLLSGQVECPSGYNYVEGSCYKLITSLHNITDKYTCEEANQTCASFDGRLANFNNSNVSAVLSYLKMWLHTEAYGAIWVGHCYILAPNIYYRKSPARDREFKFYEDSNTDINILNVLCQTEPEKTNHSCRGHQFQCNDGTCILDHHVCDSREDCVDGSDELNCTCHTDDRFSCHDTTVCISASKYCDLIFDCPDGSDEINCTMDEYMQLDPTQKQFIFANTSKYFNSVFENPTNYINVVRPLDNVSVALQDINFRRGEWRGIYKNYTNYTPYCPDSSNVRCYKDHPDCIPRHLTCVYLTNSNNQMKYCPNGIHLQYCKNFHCPNMFKCPNSYCIPYSKLCNGVSDCKGGIDEQNCSNLICPGLFKCRFDGICIDQKFRCDGIIDCPKSQEDELLCDSFPCPTNCSCFERSVDCSNRNLSEIPNVPTESRSYNLSFNNIDLISSFMPKLPFLMVLFMKHCSLQDIPENTFKYSNNMLTLDLSHNNLQNISNKTLYGLVRLKKLILSNNLIKTISLNTFIDMRILEMLDLRNNIIEYMDDNLFYHTYIRVMKVDEYIFCCLAPDADCVAPTDIFSSCDDLIASPVLRVVIWILGVLALVGNIFVILWRLKHSKKDHQTLLIISLALADLMMGIYLLTIARIDIYYRGRYAQNSKLWQNTILCKVCGYITALSSQISVGQIVIISLNRWYAVTKPFKQSPFTVVKNRFLSCINAVACMVLCSSPFWFPSYFGENFIQNGVCLFYNFTSGLYPGWEFITFIFLTFNAVCFVLVAFLYIWMYITMTRSRHAAARVCSLEDRILTRKMAILVITDGICWLPIIITGILGLNGQQINPQWSVWLALFILPVNSALNPFLYSFTAIMKSRKLPKMTVEMVK